MIRRDFQTVVEKIKQGCQVEPICSFWEHTIKDSQNFIINSIDSAKFKCEFILDYSAKLKGEFTPNDIDDIHDLKTPFDLSELLVLPFNSMLINVKTPDFFKGYETFEQMQAVKYMPEYDVFPYDGYKFTFSIAFLNANYEWVHVSMYNFYINGDKFKFFEIPFSHDEKRWNDDRNLSTLPSLECVTPLAELCFLLSRPEVDHVEHKISESVNTKRIKKGKRPLFSYHVLTVDSNNSRTVNETTVKGSLKRSHLRRGHVRHLSDGRKVNIKPSKVKGGLDGFVDKDYLVKMAVN